MMKEIMRKEKTNVLIARQMMYKPDFQYPLKSEYSLYNDRAGLTDKLYCKAYDPWRIQIPSGVCRYIYWID